MDKTIQKPLLPETIESNGTIWKKVQGYINTYASEDGRLSLLNSRSELIKPSTVQWKTTKGSYSYARVITDDFVIVQKAIHQLICQTYKGNPPKDGRSYEPNHINGDKHDNRPCNLEWVTRADNVQHAFNSGLCSAGLRIQAINKNTGEVKNYNSLSFMAREWGIPRHQLRNTIARHRNVPYMNEWTFILDDSSDKKINRHQRNPVMYKDYVSGVVTVVEDAEKASTTTGVLSGTIISRLDPKKSIKSANNLLSRYVFKKVSDKTDWPSFTVEQAIESEQKYLLNKQKLGKSRVLSDA